MAQFNRSDLAIERRTGAPCSPAQLNYSGAEHAMFAEMLLMDPGCRWYRSVSDRIAAAAVHAQLAHTLLIAGDMVSDQYETEPRFEWARALVVRGPADGVDAELAQLTKEVP